MKIAIWLDDLRDPTEWRFKDLLESYAPEAKVRWAKGYDEFVGMVSFTLLDPDSELVALFFDNDLGAEKQGKDAFNWFESVVHNHPLLVPKPIALYAQTANPSARKTLHQGFRALHRYWEENP
jgi:hypothetical protein